MYALDRSPVNWCFHAAHAKHDSTQFSGISTLNLYMVPARFSSDFSDVPNSDSEHDDRTLQVTIWWSHWLGHKIMNFI